MLRSWAWSLFEGVTIVLPIFESNFDDDFCGNTMEFDETDYLKISCLFLHAFRSNDEIKFNFISTKSTLNPIQKVISTWKFDFSVLVH